MKHAIMCRGHLAMTDLSAAAAARLATVRKMLEFGCKAFDRDAMLFLLRLLDAKPAGEFVTRQKYDDLVAIRDSELRSLEAAEAERDRLATALAMAQARIETMRAALDGLVRHVQRINYRDSAQLNIRSTPFYESALATLSPGTGPGDASKAGE